MPPPGSERVSADQISSMKFCNAMESPKVAISDGKGSSPITWLRMVRWSSQPIAAAIRANQKHQRERAKTEDRCE